MDYDTWAITLLVFRRTRLASFQLNRKDVASISSRVLRESFEKLGPEQKEEFGVGVERKEGGACFKESKVNFTNVDTRRFTNKPHREIFRGVLRNRWFFQESISPSPHAHHLTWANTDQDRPKRRLMQGQRKNRSCKLGSQAFQHGGLFVVIHVSRCCFKKTNKCGFKR